jgi:hypothetical protein
MSERREVDEERSRRRKEKNQQKTNNNKTRRTAGGECGDGDEAFTISLSPLLSVLLCRSRAIDGASACGATTMPPWLCEEQLTRSLLLLLAVSDADVPTDATSE